MTPDEWADWLERRHKTLGTWTSVTRDEVTVIAAMLRRLATAEADADRLAKQLRKVPFVWQTVDDEKALDLHDEAVARRSEP